MSKRFALVDHNSGYYYGSFDADSALEACHAIERETPHPYPVAFEHEFALNSDVAAWVVYEMPADFDLDDSMSADVEKATDAVLRASLSRAGIYKVVEVDPNKERDREDWIASCKASYVD